MATADDNKPAGDKKPGPAAAPTSSSGADHSAAPKTPPKHPSPRRSQRPRATVPTISVDDEQMFQATQRSSYEQLRDQISQRAKGSSAVDFYDEGMTPPLSYMFFVLHYHENYLTVENLHQWPIIPHNKMRHYTDGIVFSRQNSLPVSKTLKNDVEEVLRFAGKRTCSGRHGHISAACGHQYRQFVMMFFACLGVPVAMYSPKQNKQQSALSLDCPRTSWKLICLIANR